MCACPQRGARGSTAPNAAASWENPPPLRIWEGVLGRVCAQLPGSSCRQPPPRHGGRRLVLRRAHVFPAGAGGGRRCVSGASGCSEHPQPQGAVLGLRLFVPSLEAGTEPALRNPPPPPLPGLWLSPTAAVVAHPAPSVLLGGGEGGRSCSHPVARVGGTAGGLMELCGSPPASASPPCPQAGGTQRGALGWCRGRRHSCRTQRCHPKVPPGTWHPKGIWGWAGVRWGLLLLGTGLSPPQQVPPLVTFVPLLTAAMSWGCPQGRECPHAPGGSSCRGPPRLPPPPKPNRPPPPPSPQEPACCSNALQATAAF